MNIKGFKRFSTNSALLTSYPQAWTSEKAGASVVVKMWPHLKWWHVSFTLQLSEVHQSSPLKLMLFSTSSRSSLLRGFLHSKDSSSEPSSFSIGSSLISADCYTTLSAFRFITYNTPKHEQLYRMMNFLACNPNNQVPLIMVITNDSTCANRAVTKITLVLSALYAHRSEA